MASLSLSLFPSLLPSSTPILCAFNLLYFYISARGNVVYVYNYIFCLLRWLLSWSRALALVDDVFVMKAPRKCREKNAPRIRVHVPLLSSTHTIHPSIYRTYIVFPCVMIMDGVRVSLTWCEIIAIYTRYYTSTALTEMSQCQCAYENSGQNRCVRFAWDGACVLPELYLTLASPIGANISPTKDTGTCCTFILYNIIIINSYTANISWTCRFCKAVKVTIEDIIWY